MKDSLFDITDKVIIVTGGMGQLGRQYTSALIRHGARVAVFDLTVNEEYEEVFSKEGLSGNLMTMVVDITSKEDIKKGLKSVIAKWGAPQGLVNNAAIDSPPHSATEESGPFETYPEASWDKVMAVNVKGTMLCCQVIGSLMASTGYGSIVNISSIYGLVSPDQHLYDYRRQLGENFYKPLAYSASKSALFNLTRYLATYWADSNVRSNTLVLGGVFNKQDKTFLEGYNSKVPLGRMAHEDEYNGAVIFLLSDASSYMTGSTVVIDGGWTAW